MRIGEEKRLAQAPTTCWWQRQGLDSGQSWLCHQPRAPVHSPFPYCSAEKPQHHHSPSLFAECQSSLMVSPNALLSPFRSYRLSPYEGSSPGPSPNSIRVHRCTGRAGAGHSSGGGGRVDNGRVKRVIFFSHLLIPRVCKSLSQATQSRH